MVIAEVSIIPIGTKTPSASEYVAKAIKALMQQTNIKYQLTAMGTLLEGELSQVLEAAKKMHESTELKRNHSAYCNLREAEHLCCFSTPIISESGNQRQGVY